MPTVWARFVCALLLRLVASGSPDMDKTSLTRVFGDASVEAVAAQEGRCRFTRLPCADDDGCVTPSGRCATPYRACHYGRVSAGRYVGRCIKEI